MKQAAVLALAAVVLGVSANDFDSDEYASLRARLFDSTVQKTDVKNTNTAGDSGRGGDARGGKVGRVGGSRGSVGGAQRNRGSNGGRIAKQHTDMRGASMGQSTGSSTGGAFSGTIYQAAPNMMGGGMFDSGSSGAPMSAPSIGNIGGSNSGITGSSNTIDTGNRNSANGGPQGGAQSTRGSGYARGGTAGGGRAGSSGSTGFGTGITSNTKGGENTNSNNLSATIPLPVRRSLEFLHRRALEIEDEYTWIIQQKRDLEQGLVQREAEPEFDDSEAEIFWSRDAEPEYEAEDMFDSLTARDVAEYYYLLASDY